MLEMEPWSSDLQLIVNKEGFRNTCAFSCRYHQVFSPLEIIPAGGWRSEGEMKSVSMLLSWRPWYEPQHRQLLPRYAMCLQPRGRSIYARQNPRERTLLVLAGY